MDKQPKTLLEAIRYFSDLDVATQFVAKLRWPDGPVCPRCDGKHHSYLKTRRIWKCKGCKKQFSAKVGTIFEDSPIGFDKWLPCLWMVANCKNGVSSHEMGRSLGVTQKTAWFMLHRVRLAMKTGTFQKLSGEVEADEAFIGGVAGNMHKGDRARRIKGRGHNDKTAVLGLKQRGGEIRAMVVPNIQLSTLHERVKSHVELGSRLYTDEGKGYIGLEHNYEHEFVNHLETYVRGRVHTNGLENFWSLLKRGLHGTYVSVAPFHLHRYVDEQAHRFNNREADDSERFGIVLRSVADRRLTYGELTGKV